MSTKGKVITAITVAVVLAAGGVGFYFKGGDLMGKIFSSTSCPTLTLSADSPSGNHAASVKDKVATFNLATKNTINVTDLKIRCQTPMSPLSGAKVYVDFDGANGNEVNAPSCTEGLSWPVGPVLISANSTAKINLYYDSTILPVAAGQDDPFIFSIEDIKWTTPRGESKSLSTCKRDSTVTGNILKY